MFDTIKVGKKIAELRKSHNMTQFELADELNISYQAVSNWERGNSMPDISKLPQLAELFNTSIDDILCKNNTAVSAIADGNDFKIYEHSETDINEVATIIKPQQIKEVINRTNQDERVLNIFLQYLPEEYIEDLADSFYENEKSIGLFLPYLRESKIDYFANLYTEKGESINVFLPFIHEDKIKKLAFEAFDEGRMDEVYRYLPFLNEKDVVDITRKIQI